MKTKFYFCTRCGNVIVKVVDSGVTPVCCGEEMVELKPHAEDVAKEKHLPVIERVDGHTVRVKVGSEPHPMTPDHHICFICLETDRGVEVRYLKPDEPARAEFSDFCGKILAVYEYCNIHGLWRTDCPADGCGTEKKSCNNENNPDKGRCCRFGGKKKILPMFFALLPFSLFAQDFDNSAVGSLSIDRFLGTWYEIARFDHSFERGLSYAKAVYTLNEDGTIRVVNSGIKKGKAKESVGKAKITDEQGVLRVSFFWPFFSDYRVMMLADDYSYALVGSGSDDCLWILSRDPGIRQRDLDLILAEAERRGYDTDELIWVEQNSADEEEYVAGN